MKNGAAIPAIDPKSVAGKKLVASVQVKLKEYLGKDYSDESLVRPCWEVVLEEKRNKAANEA